jgi:serine/threonine-protein kinase
MAPEQWTGQTSPKSDMYSLGVIFYEMITGRRPYIADTPGGVFLKQVTEPLPFPRQLVPNLPESVERFLLKALAKEPADRYADLGALIKEIESLLSDYNIQAPAYVEEVRTKTSEPGSVSEVPASSTPISPNPYRRVLILGGIGVAIITALIIGFPQLQGIFTPAPTSTPTRPIITAIETSSPTVTPTFTDAPEAISVTTTITPAVSPTPTLGVGSTWIRPADGMIMLYVPEGNFLMGSSDSDTQADFDEKPQHTIYLNAFWIDQTEVTNAKYATCVQDEACQAPQDSGEYIVKGYYGSPQYDQYPVHNVTWNDAQIYCSWAGGSLPTEAEWEKAARGTDGRTFPWGEGVDCSRANYACDSYDDLYLKMVASFESGISPYGAYDMAGNVYEWVLDWFSPDYYAQSPQINPTGPTSGKYRVHRGGGVNFFSNLIRAANRDAESPDTRHNRIGFRCVRSTNP